MFFQDASADIFSQKNKYAVAQGTNSGWEFFDQAADRFQKSCHAINREHPQRGLSH